jgi:tetratricopeptide (TPR) repeat protein
MSKTENIKNWELLALISAILIVVSLPVYFFTKKNDIKNTDLDDSGITVTFLGSEKCKDCHKGEYDKWQDSHHDHAMEVANVKSVLGDFNDTEFTIHGVTSRFYRRDGGFYVYTEGPDGEMGEFEITHTFGWYPLQQYLVPFPGGRLQCLPIAWDVKGKRWYRVPPLEKIAPDDWLYWTNNGQNWNGMCAECHSTNLKKNYDPDSDTYKTTWSEIDVGCEACHGPGSKHVAWAELPDMARPQVENFDLLQDTSATDARHAVELCAPCHSRRAILGDYVHAGKDLLDSLLPSLLTGELYFADGQILEEVYVYGSFTQSKMYRHGVRCSDCHDVHSTKPVKDGNALCLQCHRAEEYDTKEHHFHKLKNEKGEPIKSAGGEVLFAVGTGAECVQCHMPGKYYMGVDYRPDHSFRIPSPALNAEINSPDACLRCHVDKNTAWSVDTVTRWYGPGRRPHYGSVLAVGQNAEPEAHQDLIRLAGDPLYPVIVRATALSMLAAYQGEATQQAFELAIQDEEPLIRRTAIANLPPMSSESLAKITGPYLYDAVKGVRIEAAAKLAGPPSEHLDEDQKAAFVTVLQEFEGAMNYSTDFSFARFNLGNLYNTLGRQEDAIKNYLAAIAIDGQFFPAQVNLAMLYNQTGKNSKAEELLKEVITANPEMYDIAYSLGLLLVEMKRPEQAVEYLKTAAEGLESRSRIWYNLGLLQASLDQDTEAEAALLRAKILEPDNPDFLFALADFYIKRRRPQRAKIYAEQLIEKYPQNPMGYQLLEVIKR